MCNYLRGMSSTAEHLRPNADYRPQHLVVRQIFQSLCIASFGGFCSRVSFVAIFAFPPLRFLPFIRYGCDTIAELMNSHLGLQIVQRAIALLDCFCRQLFGDFVLQFHLLVDFIQTSE